MTVHVTPPSNPVDIGTRIDQYIKLRDKIAEIKKRHKEELERPNMALEMLEGMLLSHLNNTGLDAAKGSSGTAYKKVKRSATIADAKAFREFIIGQEEWNLADWKANAPACEDYIQEHQGVLPPGVNFHTTFEVGVRKKS